MVSRVEQTASEADDGVGPRPVTGPLRWLLLVLGCTCVGLGAAGAVLPVLPTTPFLLVAAWAFARSSRRLRAWLYGHPRFGPTLVAWHEHRAVPRRAKVAAVSLMALSLAYVAWAAADPIVPVAVGLTMACVAAFLLTRPDAPPPSR
ncbi:hypothetical protein C882_0846 [Caenispirillum salinarum AK4]|uniref:DUF454 domain-containing protein n=1 Tax=Caenispirillum salinarum AK4 TaxID=1238182 RepID=K9GVC4_9PROT|nr:YbaN family protein [Caenispirillum salinarum]EKV28634.1 hypothetical protein C882_0846 [Caenispirillum salinarum AK4]